MAGGRPTDYDPAYCEVVIALGKEGKSLTVMAAELGVSRDTIYEWSRVHQEFSDAITRAKVLSQAWWENTGQSAMFMPGFNASVWSRSMAARFPEEWRESSKTELVGKDGGAIKHDHTVGLSAETASLLASLKAGPSGAGDEAPVQD